MGEIPRCGVCRVSTLERIEEFLDTETEKIKMAQNMLCSFYKCDFYFPSEETL